MVPNKLCRYLGQYGLDTNLGSYKEDYLITIFSKKCGILGLTSLWELKHTCSTKDYLKTLLEFMVDIWDISKKDKL